MPEIKVKIKWDKPEEKEWLNKYNIQYALEKCCRNTKFKVKEIKEKNDE